MSQHYHFVFCKVCGSPGHTKRNCPTRRVQEMQDPYGTQKRPIVPALPSDPALRDADEFTLFLQPAKRL